MKLNRIIKTIPLLTASFLTISLCGCIFNKEESHSTMDVSLLKVGKADAIIVKCDSHCLLIDTGEDDDGDEILKKLDTQNIDRVDAMIITHFDKDHVGGADRILKNIPVAQIYVPNYQNSNEEYMEFLETTTEKKSVITAVTSDYTFQLGDATIQIEPPLSTKIDDPAEDYDNDFSLITSIYHGKNRLLFMADAEEKRIQEWLSTGHQTEYQFLKVPHHGKYNEQLEALFKTVKPVYSVICSSKKNPAEDKTLKLLKEYCPNIFETKDGDVKLISDSKTLTVSQE